MADVYLIGLAVYLTISILVIHKNFEIAPEKRITTIILSVPLYPIVVLQAVYRELTRYIKGELD